MILPILFYFILLPGGTVASTRVRVAPSRVFQMPRGLEIQDLAPSCAIFDTQNSRAFRE